MTEDHELYLGTYKHLGEQVPFGICSAEDRLRHLHIVGQTGTGKSTLLRNLILQDIVHGRGVGVIDPHGDLAEELLNQIPPSRISDVVYFNGADYEHPIGFNLLPRVPPDARHLVTSSVVQAFKRIWSDSWGARLEYLLRATVAALLECENVSILGIQRMLIDEQYRLWVTRQIEDPVLRWFWRNEFTSYSRDFAVEAVAPIQNKVGQLLLARPVRNIFGQVTRKVDLGFVMDQRRIFIAGLSKGLLGDENAKLLGALLVTQFQMAAMERAKMPPSERREFFLYADEFTDYVTDSFTSILSGSRKYGLALTLANQHLDQTPASIYHAITGNVGSIASFRIGYADAERLADRFGGAFAPHHFVDLPNYDMCAKLLSGGAYAKPITGRSFPPLDLAYQAGEAIVRLSRQRYATPRAVVEDRIARWVRRGAWPPDVTEK